MASTLRYDTDYMRTSATKLDSTATQMLQVKSRLNTSINSLVANYWKSDAGDAFKETYSSDWGNNVDKYVAVLREMAKMLRRAANEYDAVTRTANRVTLP